MDSNEHLKKHSLISSISLAIFSVGYFFFYNLYPSLHSNNFIFDTLNRILPVLLMGLSFYFSIILVFLVKRNLEFKGKIFIEVLLFFIASTLYIIIVRYLPRARSSNIQGIFIALLGTIFSFLSCIMAKNFCGKFKITIFLELS